MEEPEREERKEKKISALADKSVKLLQAFPILLFAPFGRLFRQKYLVKRGFYSNRFGKSRISLQRVVREIPNFMLVGLEESTGQC